ncbi:MAG: hypothetical protein AAB927_04260 [Patescibacteria group bacterium]
MKKRTGKSPALKVANKGKLKPKPIDVFEGTIDGRKMLLDASADKLVILADITGQLPKEYADKNGMRIVNRKRVDPAVIKTLKKAWSVAKATEYEMRREQKQLKREVREMRRT